MPSVCRRHTSLPSIAEVSPVLHTGFPEMLSYLLGKPMWYGSHKFANLNFQNVFDKSYMRLRLALGDVQPSADLCSNDPYATAPPSRGRREVLGSPNAEDYIFRPDDLELCPWCRVVLMEVCRFEKHVTQRRSSQPLTSQHHSHSLTNSRFEGFACLDCYHFYNTCSIVYVHFWAQDLFRLVCLRRGYTR